MDRRSFFRSCTGTALVAAPAIVMVYSYITEGLESPTISPRPENVGNYTDIHNMLCQLTEHVYSYIAHAIEPVCLPQYVPVGGVVKITNVNTIAMHRHIEVTFRFMDFAEAMSKNKAGALEVYAVLAGNRLINKICQDEILYNERVYISKLHPIANGLGVISHAGSSIRAIISYDNRCLEQIVTLDMIYGIG